MIRGYTNRKRCDGIITIFLIRDLSEIKDTICLQIRNKNETDRFYDVRKSGRKKCVKNES